MRSRKLLLIMGLFLLVLSFSLPAEGKEYNLQLDFSKGESYQLETVISQTIKQSFMGIQVVTEQSFNVEYEFDVIDITAAGNYILEVSYNNLEVESGNNSLGIEVDNFRDEIDSNEDIIASLLEEKFLIEISPRGELVDLDDYQRLLDELAVESKNLVLDRKELKSSWEHLLSYIPNSSVALGESWTKEFKLTDPVAVSIMSTYTLTESKEDEIIIDFKLDDSREKITEAFKKSLFNREGIEFKLDDEHEGEIRLDKGNNWIKSMDFKHKLVGQLITSHQENQQQIVIPTEIITEMKFIGKKFN